MTRTEFAAGGPRLAPLQRELDLRLLRKSEDSGKLWPSFHLK
jgi:hypothetical protein